MNLDGSEQKREIFGVLRELSANHPNSTLILLGQAGAGKSSISSVFFKEHKKDSNWVTSRDIRENTIDIFIDLGKKDAMQEIFGYLEGFKPAIVDKKVHLFFDAYDEYKILIETTTGVEDRVLDLLREIKDKTNEWQTVLFSLRTNTYEMYKNQIQEVLKERKVVELKEIDLKGDKPEEIEGIISKIVSNSYLSFEKGNIKRATYSIINVFSENKELPRLPIFIVVMAYISLAQVSLNVSGNGRYSDFLLFYNFARAIHSLEFNNKKIKISFDQYVKEFGELAWYRSVIDEYDFLKEHDSRFYDRMLPEAISSRVYKSLNYSELSPFVNRWGKGQINDYTFSHDNFLRLFISTFIVTKLFSKNSTDSDIETVLSIPQRKDVTEFVRDYFNSLISGDKSFPKPDNFVEIEEVLNRLTKLSEKLLGKKDRTIFDNNAVSLCIYYLGRVDVQLSRDFLEKAYSTQLETVNKIRTNDNLSIESKYELWNLRNIMVSLMKLGNSEIEKEYFERLSKSDVEREINIAFHQDYYLDIPMKEWYRNPFQSKKVFPKKTYEYLRKVLIKYTGNPQGSYFNLPYYTLLELVNMSLGNGEIFRLKDEIFAPLAFLILIGSIAECHDSSNRSIYEQNKSHLKEIIEKHLDDKHKAILSYYVWAEKESLSQISNIRNFDTVKLADNLKLYVGDNAVKDGTTLFQILQIYRLKDLQRSGWKKREVSEPESVADHTFSSIFLSSVLLDDDESSEKIMQLLMAHDLGESIIGDYLPGEIDTKEEDELKAMTDISSKLFNKSILDYFEEFSKRESRAAKLANQIDKLDPIVQLLLYLDRTDVTLLDDFFVTFDKRGILLDERIAKFYNLVKEFYETAKGRPSMNSQV